MSVHSKFYAKLALSAATAALLLATGACSSNGSGSGLSFAASSPSASAEQEPTTTDREIEDGASPGSGVMDPTPASTTEVATGGGGGGGGGGCTVNCTPVEPPTPGPQRRYATYNGRDTGTLSRLVDDANMLVSMGNADLANGLLDPLAPTVKDIDSQLSPLGKIVVADSAVVGSGLNNSSQQIGISALSNGAPTGDLIALGLLNADGAATLSLGGNVIIPAGAIPAVPTADINNALTQLASLNLGNSNLLGEAGAAAVSAVGVGLGANANTTGTLASVNLASNGALGVTVGGSQLNSAVLGTAPVTAAVGDALGQVSAGLGATGLNSNGVLAVASNTSTLGGAAPALLGVNVGAASPVTGSLATVGVLQGNSIATVSSPILTSVGLGGVTDAVNTITQTLGAAGAAGAAGGASGATSGLGGLGGLLGLGK